MIDSKVKILVSRMVYFIFFHHSSSFPCEIMYSDKRTMRNDIIMCKAFFQIFMHGEVTEYKLHNVAFDMLSSIIPTSDISFKGFIERPQFGLMLG